MKIAFENQAEYELATAILAQPLLTLVHSLSPAEWSIEISDSVVGELMTRLARHVPCVLPILGDQEDEWLVVGREHRQLSEVFQHLIRFVLPTYGLLSFDQRIAMYSPFAEGLSPIHDAARVCFGGGYIWRSPTALRKIVMQKIWQWMQLEDAGLP